MNNHSQQEQEQALQNCEAENIHQIGYIQPHGVLLVLSSDSQHIVLQVSENLADFIDLPIDGAYGKPLASLIGITEAGQVDQLIQDVGFQRVKIGAINITRRQTRMEIKARVFASNGQFILELMHDEEANQANKISDLSLLMRQLLLNSESERDIYRYFDQVASIVQALTAFDRVMVYRFDANWDGEVIAESRVESAISYKGTHFPASDIPPQARRLYTFNLVRHIVDIDAIAVLVVPTLNPATQQPLDLTYSALRSLSLVHIEYLRNMGVQASLSISLLRNGKLWGLIACHHMTAKPMSYALLEELNLISQMISAKLTLGDSRELNSLGLRASLIIGELLKHISAGTEEFILLRVLPELLNLMNATGVLMVVEGKSYVYGDLPRQGAIDVLRAWLGSRSESEIFSCDHLAQHFAPADAYSDIASGLLALPLTTDMRNCIIWFRKEKLRTLHWAGKPEKYIFKDQAGEVRLAPRNSFETWTEIWRGRCEPWSNAEIETAKVLAIALTEGLSQKSKLEKGYLERKVVEEALQESQKQTLSVLDELEYLKFALDQHAIVVMTDLGGTITYVNDKFCEISGYSKQELIGRNHRMLNSGSHTREFFHDIFNTIKSGKVWNGEICNRAKNGRLYWVMTTIVPYLNEKVKPIQYIAIKADITERKLAENQLRILAVSFEMHEAIMITDANVNIIRVNKAFQDVTGYSEDDVLGKNPRMLNSGLHDKAFYDDMWKQLLETGTWTGEIFDKRKSGQIYPKWLTITAVKDREGITTEYVAVFSDITDRKKAENEIYSLAFYDTLTSLPNRRLLLDRIRQAQSMSACSNHYGALLFLDMDKFKALNDTLGHDHADLFLIEVAKRVKNCVRDVDAVARIGGDQFVVLIEEIGLDAEIVSQKVALISERIRFALAEPYWLNEHEHHSSTSIGVCLYRGNEETMDSLLRYADIAMSQAKESGRNAVRFYEPAMQLAVEARASVEADLRKAISKQQLHLYYQIQLDNDLHPVGAEALIRWIHPVRGLVSPIHFIPIAEESTLILEIGRWVLETASKQLALWSRREETRDLVLAVNVSAQQFKRHDFVRTVSSLVNTHQVNPNHLKLELTESVVLGDVSDVVAKMHLLKAMGVRLSLDDFGTGYSSLSYLKQLPLDQIKIDQSFVRNMTTEPNDAIMVKTIIGLAENFRMEVIAEGVETDDHLTLLRQYGCKLFQGYLFSKPVPIDEFEGLLKKG